MVDNAKPPLTVICAYTPLIERPANTIKKTARLKQLFVVIFAPLR
jgi:hypothetical protein